MRGQMTAVAAGRLAAAGLPLRIAAAFSWAASSTPWASSTSSSARLNWSGLSFSDFAPNLALQIAQDALQPAPSLLGRGQRRLDFASRAFRIAFSPARAAIHAPIESREIPARRFVRRACARSRTRARVARLGRRNAKPATRTRTTSAASTSRARARSRASSPHKTRPGKPSRASGL